MAAILNRQIIASLSSCVAWLLLGSLSLAQTNATKRRPQVNQQLQKLFDDYH